MGLDDENHLRQLLGRDGGIIGGIPDHLPGGRTGGQRQHDDAYEGHAPNLARPSATWAASYLGCFEASDSDILND